GAVGRVVPAPSGAELREKPLAAIAELNRWGLTGIHDAGVGPEGIAVYDALAREGRYSLRNYVMIRSNDSVLDAFMRRGRQLALDDGRLWIRLIKLVGDGALGSRGAALRAPYAHDPGNTGCSTTPPR